MRASDEPATCESKNDSEHFLSPQKCRSLEECGNHIIPLAWASVRDANRLFLVELACSPDSVLTNEALGKGLTAERCSIWNGYDLTTGEGVRKAVKFVEDRKPRYLWIATECGPFSPIQNCNQKTEKQRLELQEKQRNARKQHVGGLVVAYAAARIGTIVCWEWSRRCRAWKWDMMDEWRSRCNTTTAIISGCRVKLVDPKTGKPLGKEWRIECTHRGLAEKLHTTCECPKQAGVHALCEGNLTRNSAFYTPEMARKIVHHMRFVEDLETISHAVHIDKGHEHEDTMNQVCSQLPFEKCWCKKIHNWNQEITCARCMIHEGHMVFAGEAAIDLDPDEPNRDPDDQQDPNGFSEEEKKRIMKNLSLIHSSTGHGSYHLLLNALRRRKVDPRVLKLAETFRCSACEERKRPHPRKQANLKVHTERWKSIQIDAAFWRHPTTKKQHQAVFIMDEASRFLVGVWIHTDGKHGVKAKDYTTAFEKQWKPYFGHPDVIRMDPEGSWRSKEIWDYFQQQGIMLDSVPAEAHWNMSHVERCIEWAKEFLTKTTLERDDVEVDQLLSQAVWTWNHREVVRGYSPFQHALGRLPDSDGRFFEDRVHNLPLEMMQLPEGEHETAEALRASAEKAFIDWQLQEKLTRARNSRHHKLNNFVPGDLVFYWRTQILGNESHAWNRGNYVGPARVLAVETRLDEDNRLRPGSVVWLVKNNRLVKVAVEQLRHASCREENLHELERPTVLPWTFSGIADGLRKGSFEDHTGEGPTGPDRMAVEPQEEEGPKTHPTGGRRFHQKRGPVVSEDDMDIDLEEEGTEHDQELRRIRRRTQPGASSSRFETSQPWQDMIDESLWVSEDTCFWNQQEACVEIEVHLPEHQRGWKRFTKDAKAFFISALKRRSVEVSERHLSKEEHEMFKESKQTEVDKFIAAEALKVLPPELQPSKQQAMKMRWVLTWKKLEEGGAKPKARAVVLGYQDPEYAYRPTFAPTMTRHSRQLLLQWSANNNHTVAKGDVSAAFLQGREFNRDMFLIPTDEICQSLGVPTQSVVKMRKACYGLVEAPIEWFETMNDFLKSLGFDQLQSDPCFWRLVRGTKTVAVISGHVDDFLFCGPDQDEEWQQIKTKIQQKFKWQEWEYNDFIQCGVRVTAHKDGGYELDQVKYLEEVSEIQITKERRKQTKEPITEQERTELRGLLGALSWHTSQVGYRFSAYVSLHLSEVNQATVQNLIDVNSLLGKIKSAAKSPMRIFPFKDRERPQVYCWTDASSQNRHDGSSTKGIFIGMSGSKLENGEIDRVSPWYWQSGKIDRVCRSPGSAEARAAIDAEDSMYMLRFQWAEILGYTANVHDIDTHVKMVGGVLITDSRNVYDRVLKPYITPKGAQKRIDLELLTLKESQNHTNLKIRWVNSQAMLANSITKRGEDFQMCRFVQLGQSWRIIHDDNMFSGKKRKGMGKEVLDT